MVYMYIVQYARRSRLWFTGSTEYSLQGGPKRSLQEVRSIVCKENQRGVCMSSGVQFARSPGEASKKTQS